MKIVILILIIVISSLSQTIKPGDKLMIISSGVVKLSSYSDIDNYGSTYGRNIILGKIDILMKSYIVTMVGGMGIESWGESNIRHCYYQTVILTPKKKKVSKK